MLTIKYEELNDELDKSGYELESKYSVLKLVKYQLDEIKRLEMLIISRKTQGKSYLKLVKDINALKNATNIFVTNVLNKEVQIEKEDSIVEYEKDKNSGLLNLKGLEEKFKDNKYSFGIIAYLRIMDIEKLILETNESTYLGILENLGSIINFYVRKEDIAGIIENDDVILIMPKCNVKQISERLNEINKLFAHVLRKQNINETIELKMGVSAYFNNFDEALKDAASIVNRSGEVTNFNSHDRNRS